MNLNRNNLLRLLFHIYKKVERIIEWKNNSNSFLEELKKNKQEDAIWRSVVEQYVWEGEKK